MTRCINLACEFYFHGPAWLPGRVRKILVQLVCWFMSVQLVFKGENYEGRFL